MAAEAADIKKPKVFVATMCGSERDGWIAPQLNQTLLEMNRNQHYDLLFASIYGIKPVDVARNQAVKAFLSTDADWLMMVDNDTAPPAEVLDTLDKVQPGMDVICIPALMWWQSILPVLNIGEWVNGRMVTPSSAMLKDGGIKPIDVCGTGCIFIHRRVVEGLPEPWFRTAYDPMTGLKRGEDVNFTSKAKKAGFGIYANLDMLCQHFHSIDLIDVSQNVTGAIQKYLDIISKKTGCSFDLADLSNDFRGDLMQQVQSLDAVKIEEDDGSGTFHSACDQASGCAPQDAACTGRAEDSGVQDGESGAFQQ